MTKKEYIDLLRYYFAHANKSDVEEIISDYEDHFQGGYEKGLDDDEIIKSLGSPESIYAEYISEGIVTERRGLLKGDLYAMMERGKESFKNSVKPQLPKILENTSKFVLVASSVVAYLITIAFWFLTPVLLFLLSINYQPFANIAPIPHLSIITTISIGATGFFAGLTTLFIGNECRNVSKLYHEKNL